MKLRHRKPVLAATIAGAAGLAIALGVAASQSASAATSTPSPSASGGSSSSTGKSPAGGPGGHGPGGHGPGGFGGGFGGDVLHGEETVQQGTTVKTIDQQSGTVTAVSSTSITVKSTDGFVATYVVNSSTAVGKSGSKSTIAAVKVGDTVRIEGDKVGSTVTATRIMDGKPPTGTRPSGGGPAGGRGDQPAELAAAGTAAPHRAARQELDRPGHRPRHRRPPAASSRSTSSEQEASSLPTGLPGFSQQTLRLGGQTAAMTEQMRASGDRLDRAEQSRVLVVDDESAITELVSMALRYEGYSVQTAANGQDALNQVASFRPDLVILDVMLPDLDGFEVAGRLGRERRRVPVLFLTARDATEDKVHGLTIGGDDYVTKPFSVSELVARVRVILRRSGGDPEAATKLVLADLEMDEDSREVFRDGKLVELTATEYRLLQYLLVNARTVLTRAQLLDHVWQYDFHGDASVLETYISYLRRKVDTVEPRLIHTVRGVGYVLRTPRG